MGKSSKDKRDIYYRLGKSEGYRARSAYKLLHLDEHFHLFDTPGDPVRRVVDLCAAPGSWSQVLSKRLNEGNREGNESAKIIAVDLQPMAPLPGVVQLVGDITKAETAKAIIDYFEGEKADLVVCDGAPDVTGLHDLDEFIQSQLLLAALTITLSLLRPGGTFVAKIFRGRDADLLFDQLRCHFEEVTCAKPRSSRNSSIEAFVICRSHIANPIPSSGLSPVTPFVACGDLSTWGDADMTYPAVIDEATGAPREGLDVIEGPTEPPYKEWMEKRKKGEI